MAAAKAAGNPNSNCLAGFQCPECGHYGPFTIAVHAYMVMHDSGGWKVENPEYDETSSCICNGCGHIGRVDEFCPESEDAAA